MDRLWKHTYMKAIHARYQKADLPKKKRMLDEFCETYRCHRKHAIRLLNGAAPSGERPPRRGGRARRYQGYIVKVLEAVWEAAYYPWSARLKAALPSWMPSIKKRFPLSPLQEEQLLRISPATIDRLLAGIKLRLRRRTYGTTKPGTLLKHMIPIQTKAPDVRRPGFLEIDTVAHCGASGEGSFLSTLDTIDLDTAWCERRAVLGKGEAAIVEAMADIQTALPFPLRAIDSDGGGEFINYSLLRFCRERKMGFTRSRPYKKNDNAHIEQKNWTHVRKLLGYARFESPEALLAINDLYRNELRLFQNVFQPSVKLLKKVKRGARVTRVYSSPQTPWERVLASRHSDPAKIQRLKDQAQGLDPFVLSEAIDRKLLAIQRLVARGPLPKPRFHPSWGRKSIRLLGTPPGIPTSTLGTWHDEKQNPIKKLEKNLQKERFLQTI
jgi:hypothetical protein